MKSLTAIAIMTAMVVGVRTAAAGSKKGAHVVVKDTSASGSLGFARNAADNKQEIGCVTMTFGNPITTALLCFATDETGKSVACTTTTPALIAAAATLRGDSNLTFELARPSGLCTSIAVGNASSEAPKAP
jgi:hypothetical protein